jgi:hypothetical protein
MTSKWIKELKEGFDLVELYDSDDAWEQMKITLDRVDSLLFRAMLEVENITLSDDIEKELHGTA